MIPISILVMTKKEIKVSEVYFSLSLDSSKRQDSNSTVTATKTLHFPVTNYISCLTAHNPFPVPKNENKL